MRLSPPNRLLVALNLPGIALIAVGSAILFSISTDSCSGYMPPSWNLGNTLLKAGSAIAAVAFLANLGLLIARRVDGRAGGIAIGACMAAYVLVGIDIASSLQFCF